jgi:hypothetical protein
MFDVDVQLRNLFERPTLLELAEVIDGMRWATNSRGDSLAEGPREEVEF